jgi:hypothetical protein
MIPVQKLRRRIRITRTATIRNDLCATNNSPLFDISLWKDDHWEVDHSMIGTATQSSSSSSSSSQQVQETWNWCRHFVVKYNLCPWAKQSTDTKHAIHFYVLPDTSADEMEEATELAALEFHQAQKDPQTAISFVILINDKMSGSNSLPFDEFYNRFLDLEDEFFDHDNLILRHHITLAPFHPEWMFAEDEPVLAFEKRSPYPTISIVSAQTIEEAGPVATEQIGRNNAKILNSRSFAEWQSIYNAAIRSSGETNPQID